MNAKGPDFCTRDDCNKPFYAKGLCEMHYKRQKLRGDASPRARDDWTELEERRLRAVYAAYPWPDPIPFDDVVPLFPNRTRKAIEKRAFKLGLHEIGREGNRRRYLHAQRSCPECHELFRPNFPAQAFCSNKCSSKRRWERHPHPRGATGIQFSDEALAKIAAGSQRFWDSLTPEERAAQMAPMHAGLDAVIRAGGRAERTHTRGRGGRRPDLNDAYFRSRWEANYARYLNFLQEHDEIASWEYEPRTFEFARIKRGTRFYTPDFRVRFEGGRYEWHEVKGWLTAQGKTALDRFARYWPEEHERLVMIDEPVYRQIAATMSWLPGWEADRSKVTLKRRHPSLF